MMARPVPRIDRAAPSATVLSDSTSGGQRYVELRVVAPSGSTSLDMRVRNVQVVASAIDGLVVDTTRYRQRSAMWTMQYWAVPDSGAKVSLTLRGADRVELDLLARSSGLPTLAGVTIPARPDDVVPVQYGDVTVVRRRLVF